MGICILGNGQVLTDTLTAEEEILLRKKLDKELKRSERNLHVSVLPTIYYTPETRFAFGAVGILNFRFNKSDTLLPVSRISPTFVYTLNEQMITQVGFDLYPNKKWWLFGDVGYFVYPYFFGGVGNQHSGNYIEWYDASYPKLNLNVYRKVVSDSIFVGIRYDYQNSTIIPESGKLLDLGGYSGANGSVQSSIGIGIRYDSRDHIFSSTKGWYTDVSFMWTNPNLGASYTDQFLTADIRKYIPIFQRKDVLALQVYSESHSGNVPFNLMAMLGGSERMRGYREGVFRDTKMMVYQAEYRSRILFKYFAFAVFANLGGVGADFQEVNRNYRVTLGGGVRYTFLPKERIFIRFDYGIGEQTQGFYLAVGEAF